MIQNYFKIAWRNISKNKIFSAINIFGLAVGFTCCLLIALFIRNEISFDKFHTHAASIYRLTSIPKATNGTAAELAVTPSPWAPRMKQDYPEIKEFARLLKSDKTSITTPSKENYYESDILFADSTFFNVFSFSLLNGDSKHALDRPNTIVLAKETARKYFGNTDPVGKTLVTTTPFGPAFNLEITGVVDEAPANSHFKFKGLISMRTLGDISNMWQYHMFTTYFVLASGVGKNDLESKFKDFNTKYIANNSNADGPQEIHLQALTDIHFHSQMTGEIGVNSSDTYVYLFSAIAFFVLVIACLNFINLSTVQSLKRAKETGLRKVIGAGRMQLVKQFLGESVLITLLAFIFSLMLAFLFLPVFNRLADRALQLDLIRDYRLIVSFFVLAIVIGIISGIYPAYIQSSFKPVDVLKNQHIKLSGGNLLRKSLVTFQFVISIGLMAGTLLVYKQLQFIKNKDLGFNKDGTFIISVPTGTDGTKIETFKNVLLQHQGIVAGAAASTLPGTQIPINLTHTGTSEKDKSMQMLFVDHDFIKATQMQVIAGRSFSKQFATDSAEGFILNRAAVAGSGWKTPQEAIGKTFQWKNPNAILKNGKVVGVVEDFNITPLKSSVQPLVMHILPRRFQYLYVRYKDIAISDVVALSTKEFKSSFPNLPFEYTFLDERINSLYAAETKLGTIFGYFAGLAILLACLGILGLSVYATQRRTKEIGIRKILGASIAGICKELSKEFLKPVLIASIIASPVAWWGMHKWLEGFAYKAAISWWIFAIAGMTGILIALLTVSFHAIKAATANPVKSLRTE
ncbi:MAG: hypothetical protein JWQ30_2559 [Sediminibacterium sp.]|nr:hypothetical protein [Sediminibacterium sp.]